MFDDSDPYRLPFQIVGAIMCLTVVIFFLCAGPARIQRQEIGRIDHEGKREGVIIDETASSFDLRDLASRFPPQVGPAIQIPAASSCVSGPSEDLIRCFNRSKTSQIPHQRFFAEKPDILPSPPEAEGGTTYRKLAFARLAFGFDFPEGDGL